MWLTRVESRQRNAPLQIQKIYVLNVDPPPKLCEIDKKYRDPSVSIYTIYERVTIHVAVAKLFCTIIQLPLPTTRVFVTIYNPLIGAPRLNFLDTKFWDYNKLQALWGLYYWVCVNILILSIGLIIALLRQTLAYTYFIWFCAASIRKVNPINRAYMWVKLIIVCKRLNDVKDDYTVWRLYHLFEPNMRCHITL